MSYTVYDFSESLGRLEATKLGFAKDDVAECLMAWGKNGDFAEWEGGFLLRLNNGKHILLTGWCDTTGWGCRDGIEASIADTADELISSIPADQETDDRPEDLNRFLRGEIDEFGE